MSRKCCLGAFFLQLWNLKTMIHESFVVLDNLDTCSLEFWCIRQAVPNIPTIEIWTAVGVPAIDSPRRREGCVLFSFDSSDDGEGHLWWCAEMWWPRAETVVLLARLARWASPAWMQSNREWWNAASCDAVGSITSELWRSNTNSEDVLRRANHKKEIKSLLRPAWDSADGSDTAARKSDFNHAHSGSAHHVYVQWRAIPNIHGLRPLRVQVVTLQQPNSDLALKFGRRNVGLSTTRTFADGGRRTFPVLLVVCFGTFLLKHTNIGNLAPKKTRLHSRCAITCDCHEAGHSFGISDRKRSDKVLFRTSRLPEPAFTRDGRARLRPQRAIVLDHTLPSTQCTSLNHCATAFLFVSLRSRAPWTTNDSVFYIEPFSELVSRSTRKSAIPNVWIAWRKLLSESLFNQEKVRTLHRWRSGSCNRRGAQTVKDWKTNRKYPHASERSTMSTFGKDCVTRIRPEKKRTWTWRSAMSHQRGHFEAPWVLYTKDDACGEGRIRKDKNGHQCVLKVGGIEKCGKIPSGAGLEPARGYARGTSEAGSKSWNHKSPDIAFKNRSLRMSLVLEWHLGYFWNFSLVVERITLGSDWFRLWPSCSVLDTTQPQQRKVSRLWPEHHDTARTGKTPCQ